MKHENSLDYFRKNAINAQMITGGFNNSSIPYFMIRHGLAVNPIPPKCLGQLFKP